MSIGETLAAARRHAGLTVADVAAATFIRETIVVRVESDDFEPCGGDFYARGHIRSIAAVVGLEPEPLLRQYDEEHAGSARYAGFDPSSSPATMAPTSTDRGRGRRPVNWTLALAVVLVAVAGYGVFQLAAGPAQSGSEPARQAAPPPAASPPPSPSESPPGTDSPAPPPNRAPPGKAVVRVEATERTWISAHDGQGSHLYSASLTAGESVRLTDEQLVTLVVGNLGGVSLTVNGEELGVIGEPGEVLDELRVYPDRVEGLPS